MDDFGRSALPTGPNTELGPYFEQPALSLVGDAAVVLGDCYNVELRSTQLLDRAGNEIGTEACLLPPVVPRKFESDSLLRLNLSTCPSTIAPFHMHDHQPAAIAAMISLLRSIAPTSNGPRSPALTQHRRSNAALGPVR